MKNKSVSISSADSRTYTPPCIQHLQIPCERGFAATEGATTDDLDEKDFGFLFLMLSDDE